MAEYLRSLLDNPDWSDVTLRVGSTLAASPFAVLPSVLVLVCCTCACAEHTIRAMKGLLARSPYFRAMFNPKSKFSESKQV